MRSLMGPVGKEKTITINALGYEIDARIMLFATAFGGRFNGKEQDEA